MKQFRFETSLEPMTSRIPSMFAYLEFNEDWTTTLHPASDSFNGSWGKVVENIMIPCGVNLCTYVKIDNEPVPYLWTEQNTFPINENIEDEYSIDSSEYIRMVEGYFYVDTEEVSYHVYVECDFFPEEIIENSPKFIKVPKLDKVGNYILDCDGEKTYNFYEKNVEYTFYEKACLIKEGETYSYRTLIDYYYQYKDTLPTDNTFISFMKRGIGKIVVDKDKLQMINETVYPNVPDFIYLAQVKMLIEKYRKYHRLCEYYKTHFVNIGRENDTLKEKCEYYETMGGDKFLKYLEKLLKKVNETASEYLCYAQHSSNNLSISLNVPLFQSKNDMGYLSTYINEFIPGIHFRHGELLTYNGRTYICLLNRFISGGNNYEYCLCNGELFKLSSNTYNKIQFGNLLLTQIPSTIYNGYIYIFFNGEYYIWVNGGYEKINVVEYCAGFWNEELEINEFDPQHFVLLTEYINNTSSIFSIPEKTILPENDKWYSDTNVYGNKFKIYAEVGHLPQHFIYPNIKKDNSFYVWDETVNMYIIDPTNAGSYTVEGKTDSILKTFRKYEQFIDDNELFDEPDSGEDWLYYYKIGTYYTDRGILKDEIGNIQRFSGISPVVGQYVTDLKAYGTILTNIECDIVERTLTFTYVVNAHFKAKLMGIDIDDDGNEKYNYGEFEYDENDNHGVVFMETYSYLDTDIDELYNNGDFQAFVENRAEDITNYMQKYGYKRFRFSVMEQTTTVNVNNNEYEYAYIRSEYSETVENELDYIYQPLFKKDYFVGYSYEPIAKDEVDIRRGNGSAYEMHCRLGEIKTMEDMVSLQNGAFYNFNN